MLITASLLLALAPSAHADRMFEPRSFAFDTGLNPTSLAVAYLDADWRPDLVTSNAASNSVSVLLGIGDGTFWSRTDYGIPNCTPGPIALADLNGDGYADLAVASGSGVSVLLGYGNGTFGSAANFESGDGGAPTSMVVTDLDQDRRPDLVVARYASSTVSVLLGMGDGTFEPSRDFAVGFHPNSVAVSHLDYDEWLDLAIAGEDSTLDLQTGRPHGQIWLLLGDGKGSFVFGEAFPTQEPAQSVAIADLNQDGLPDLATANRSFDGRDQSVLVLLAHGDGSFELRAMPGIGGRTLALADIDSDMRPDLVLASETGVSVLRGVGNGAFGRRADFAMWSGNALVIADFNGDLRPDLATVGGYRGSVLLAACPRAFPSQPPILEYPSPGCAPPAAALPVSCVPIHWEPPPQPAPPSQSGGGAPSVDVAVQWHTHPNGRIRK